VDMMDEVRVSSEPDRERANLCILLLAFTACLSASSLSSRFVGASGRRGPVPVDSKERSGAE
jgi:hypothetical protein